MSRIGVFCPDIVRLLATLLDARDVLHVGMTCKMLQREILDNDGLWYFLVLHRFPSVPLSTFRAASELHRGEWKSLAFCSSDLLVKQKLQLAHLLSRLEAPPANRNYLRFFCRISTAGIGRREVSYPDVILTMDGEPTIKHNLSMSATFAHKAGSILYWSGENEIKSSVAIYAVDRQKPGVTTNFEHIVVIPKYSTLSKSQYELIGKTAHGDATYYLDGTATTSYNYSTEHGGFRSGQEKYGFASNSSSRERPSVRVHCWTSVEVHLDLEECYKMFCS